MPIFVILTIWATFFPECQLARAGQEKQVEAELQGNWQLVSMRFIGGEVAKVGKDGKVNGEAIIVQVEGTKATWKINGVGDTFSFKIDTTKPPHAIDFTNGKETQRAIFDVRGSRLRIGIQGVLVAHWRTYPGPLASMENWC